MQNQEPAQRRSLCNVYVRSDSSVSQRLLLLLLVLALVLVLAISYQNQTKPTQNSTRCIGMQKYIHMYVVCTHVHMQSSSSSSSGSRIERLGCMYVLPCTSISMNYEVLRSMQYVEVHTYIGGAVPTPAQLQLLEILSTSTRFDKAA